MALDRGHWRAMTTTGRKPLDGQAQRITPAGLVRRFFRARGGATAIEFVILALPFSALIFAILESCVSFAAQQLISNATDDIARQIRTGQGMSYATIQARPICAWQRPLSLTKSIRPISKTSSPYKKTSAA